MSATELLAPLRAATAALAAARAEAERLRQRVEQLEAIARLNDRDHSRHAARSYRGCYYRLSINNNGETDGPW